MLFRSNLPSIWWYLVIGISRSNTFFVTVFWLSGVVEKIWEFLVGITGFLKLNF